MKDDGFEFGWDIRNFKNLGSNLVLIILLTKRRREFRLFHQPKDWFRFGSGCFDMLISSFRSNLGSQTLKIFVKSF